MSLVIKSQWCSPCGTSDVAGLDVSCMAMIAVIGGYRFLFSLSATCGDSFFHVFIVSVL